MTTHEVLVKARNDLDRGVWEQGCARRGTDGRGCALEFLFWAAEKRMGPYLEAAESLGVAATGRRDVDMARWNDAPGRTKEEVLAAFDRAIAATAPEPPFDTLQPEAPDRAPEPVACP